MKRKLDKKVYTLNLCKKTFFFNYLFSICFNLIKHKSVRSFIVIHVYIHNLGDNS